MLRESQPTPHSPTGRVGEEDVESTKDMEIEREGESGERERGERRERRERLEESGEREGRERGEREVVGESDEERLPAGPASSPKIWRFGGPKTPVRFGLEGGAGEAPRDEGTPHYKFMSNFLALFI